MIINLTQHCATREQISQGAVDLPPAQRGHLIELLTVNSLPTSDEIRARCNDIALLAVHNGLGGDGDDPHPLEAMIGGAPWMMSALEKALINHGVTPIYAFSVRESVETVVDGGVMKTATFRHVGFVRTEGQQSHPTHTPAP